MENNNGDCDFVNFGENERESRVPGSVILTENDEMLAKEEDGEAAGAELERFETSEIHLHQLVQGESSSVAAEAEESVMEEADHDSHHKRAKVYSGLAFNFSESQSVSVSGISSDAGNSGSSVEKNC